MPGGPIVSSTATRSESYSIENGRPATIRCGEPGSPVTVCVGGGRAGAPGGHGGKRPAWPAPAAAAATQQAPARSPASAIAGGGPCHARRA